MRFSLKKALWGVRYPPVGRQSDVALPDKGPLRAVGGKRRSVGRSALFERVSAWFYGDAGGSVLSLPELNWRYAIRRRVGGNAGVYPGMSHRVRLYTSLCVWGR